jgi:hypothetical protein
MRYDAITSISCINKALQALVSVYRFKSAWQQFLTCPGTGRFSAFLRFQGWSYSGFVLGSGSAEWIKGKGRSYELLLWRLVARSLS